MRGGGGPATKMSVLLDVTELLAHPSPRNK